MLVVAVLWLLGQASLSKLKAPGVDFLEILIPFARSIAPRFANTHKLYVTGDGSLCVCNLRGQSLPVDIFEKFLRCSAGRESELCGDVLFKGDQG